MQHTVHTCRPKLGTWLALFIVVALLLSGFAQPGVQAAPEAPLASPNQPALVSPADAADGVATPPTLSVTVSDPDSNPMTVSFYGRAKSAPTPDFTLIVIPDTQNMSTSYPSVFNSMTQWIAGQKTARNIVFATHVGDLVNSSTSATEWGRADTAMDYLDAGGVPYSVGPGNHDLGGSYNTYFGPSRFTGNGYYQGPYASGANENNYSFFSAGGMDFIIINLQYSSTTAHYDWADALLKANPGRRGIVVKHDILNITNTWQNQAPYTALKDNPNLFLMLCGHMHSSTDGSAYRAELGDDEHTIHILMTDYQDYPSGGNGYLRILRFSPADDKIYAQVYSPYISTYLTNASNYEEFAMAYDLAGAPAFELIGTVTGVASGANASISWGGLSPSMEYEWYAVANDGTAGPNSATWSFTTAALAVPEAPVVTSIGQSSGNVTLGWGAVTKDMNGNTTTITKYQVYGSHDPFFEPSVSELLGEPTPPTATTFTHTGGSTGTTNWYYLVRAVNVSGESANSARRTGRFGFTLVPGSGS